MIFAIRSQVRDNFGRTFPDLQIAKSSTASIIFCQEKGEVIRIQKKNGEWINDVPRTISVQN